MIMLSLPKHSHTHALAFFAREKCVHSIGPVERVEIEGYILTVDPLTMYQLVQKLIGSPQKESGFLVVCQNESVEPSQVQKLDYCVVLGQTN